ncbi:hypothetical protein ES708_21704 [subsurface metagenome]
MLWVRSIPKPESEILPTTKPIVQQTIAVDITFFAPNCRASIISRRLIRVSLRNALITIIAIVEKKAAYRAVYLSISIVIRITIGKNRCPCCMITTFKAGRRFRGIPTIPTFRARKWT